MDKHPGYTGRTPRGRMTHHGPANEPDPHYDVKPIKRFKPKKEFKIGIGITTHNRNENARRCLTNILLTTPEAHRIVVVDDASDVPFENADFRFLHNVGIAKAKNKCIELLDDCDYIFLFDDDTWPVQLNWWKPYVQSGVHHLSFTFSHLHDGRPNRNEFLKNEGEISYYSNPCGCMLFMTKELIEKIGGFDIGFGQYGNEHVDFSVRAYFANMVAHPFMDIAYSLMLFHSLDYFLDTKTSVKSRMGIWNTKGLIGRKGASLVPYSSKGDEFLVLTSYFTYTADPQRGHFWNADLSKILPLAKSVVDHGGRVVIFHDCFEDKDIPYIPGVKWQKCKPDDNYNPYLIRHKVYLDYLKSSQIDCSVFGVDATDVICLSGPKYVQKGFLYVGNEHGQIVDNDWLKNDEKPYAFIIADYRNVIDPRKSETLLNCGIIGGHKETYIDFLQKMWAVCEKYGKGVKTSSDMPLGSYIFFKYFQGSIISGSPVNTRFKYFEKDNGIWFQHK